MPTLEDLILNRGMTVTEFCAMSGVARNTLWRACSGRIEFARDATIIQIADALGVKPAKVRAAIKASRAEALA